MTAEWTNDQNDFSCISEFIAYTVYFPIDIDVQPGALKFRL